MAFQLFLGSNSLSGSTDLTAVAAVGFAATIPGFDKDLPLTGAAGTATALPFAIFPSVILGAVAGTGAAGVFDLTPLPTFGPISAVGSAHAFAGISESDPLYAAPPAETAFGEFTVVVTSPAVLGAVAALGAVGSFIVQAVIPPPSPEPGPPLSPVIVSPVHFLNWVWPLTRRGHNTPPITNGIMLEDDTGAILLEDSTPLLLE